MQHRFSKALTGLTLALATASCGAARAASTAPAAPRSRGIAPIAFDSARLMTRLAALSADSMEGRGAGTAGSARARRWIIRELQAMGAQPLGPSFEQVVKLPARPGADTLGANVVVRIPGTSGGGRTIVLGAHYDHLGVRNGEIFNGADDDASGCVALLAIAERLLRERPQHDVVLAFFDSEERGMHGSRTFVASGLVATDQIALNISLDMIARQDGGALWVSGTAHYPTLKPIADAAVADSKVPIRFGHDTKSGKPSDDWTNSSDHASFHAKGIPFLYLGVEDHADYHRSGDDADKVDPGFFSGTVGFAYRLFLLADERLRR